jgi:hypothetical protein
MRRLLHLSLVFKDVLDAAEAVVDAAFGAGSGGGAAPMASRTVKVLTCA